MLLKVEFPGPGRLISTHAFFQFQEFYLDLDCLLYAELRFSFTEMSKKGDDLPKKAWMQIKPLKSKHRWNPLMIMKKNIREYKKVPATSKIDFSIILPKMSSRRLKQLFFNGFSWINDCISHSILCLEMWHLKLLFLTMCLCIWVLLASTLKILFLDMKCIDAVIAIFWITIWIKKVILW